MKIKKNRNLGFTLIELLIVIALLGALAVGLLASIDPFEQLKKGTDTSVRNMVSEVYNASIRYYAAKNGFPWGVDITAVDMNQPNFTSASTGYLSLIEGAGELKAGFGNLAGTGNLSKIKVTSLQSAGGTRSTVTVCYMPDSKSFQNDANTKYTETGTLQPTSFQCKSTTGGTADCYWCVL